MQNEIEKAVESVLFATGEPVSVKELCDCFHIKYNEMDSICEALKKRFSETDGIIFMHFGESIQLCTNPKYHEQVELMLNPVQKKSLTQASLEVLSIVAYKQPITRGEIEDIRGVKCDYSVMWLLQKGMIKEVGRKDTVGKPMLFGTTDLFLRHFGLESLSDLPEKPHELQETDEQPE